VVVPAGTFLTGPVVLRSRVFLMLLRGATLTAAPEPSLYPIQPYFPPQENFTSYQPVVTCPNCTNSGVVGEGVIEGCGWQWWQNFSAGTLNHTRPKLVEFVYGRNLYFSGITLQNSPFWNLHIIYSSNVVVDGMIILAPRPVGNTDGVDLDSCTDSVIRNTLVDVGDDGICIKASLDPNGVRRPTARVEVYNCTVLSRNIAFGSVVAGGIHDVTVRNCTISTPEGTAAWAIKIKGHQYDGGGVENVLLEDLTVGRLVSTVQHPQPPFFLSMLMNYGNPDAVASGPRRRLRDPPSPPVFRNITLRRIDVLGTSEVGTLTGLSNSNITDMVLEDVVVHKYDHGWKCQFVNDSHTLNVVPAWTCS
jgi:polygalacturonase